MGYIILYFSIGLALAIAIYLYDCYDYRVNFKDYSWKKYKDINHINNNIVGFLFLYPLMLLILVCIGLRRYVVRTMDYIRECIFKIIDKYFVK